MAADEPASAAGLDEIRAVMADLPGPDLESATTALTRRTQLERTAGPLGSLGDHVEWLATWQARHPPSLGRPRVAVFAGNHGIARGRGPAEALVEEAVAGRAPVNAVCTIADADLRVFEMSLETPTRDAAVEPAMDDEECARAIAYGMMAVEQGLDLLCLDAVGAGAELAAAAMSQALFGESPEDWIGGGGLTPAKQAADLHRHAVDPFDALRRIGGFEMCAVVGAVIAARLARTPVILGGYAATAAAAVLFAADRHALDHCRAACLPPAGGPRRLTEILKLAPLTDFGSSMGGGAEAALAIPVLRAAVEIHATTATPAR